MIEISFSDLQPAAKNILENIEAILPKQDFPANELVLFFCTQSDLGAYPDSLPGMRLETAYDKHGKIALLPAIETLEIAQELIFRAITGKQAFEVKNSDIFTQISQLIPANVPIKRNNRIFFHFVQTAQNSLHNAPMAPASPASDAENTGLECVSDKHDFAMYCKTYRGDFQRASVMVETFNKHNRDDIKLYLSAPLEDQHLFAPFANRNIEVITDESYAAPFLTDQPLNGMSPGYVNQEICKLTFYTTGLADNYLAIDSDCVLIRDFYVSDFMHDAGIPYTVLVQDKDLSIERHYRDVHWVSRQEMIAEIYAEMGVRDRRLRTCHGAQILNSRVLDSLKNVFMESRGLSYIDLLKISPYEFTWYNVWFQKCRLIPEFAVEPFFKILHMRPEYIFSRLKGLRQEDFAHAYVGLVMNSKWRPTTPLRYEDPTISHITFYNAIMKDEEIIDAIAKFLSTTPAH